MINLLPPEGHKALKREYILRMGAALSFLFGLVFLLLGAALIPTYVLVEAQISASLFEVTREQDEENAFQKARQDVKETELILEQIKTTQSRLFISVVVDEVRKRTPPNITFSRFFVAESPEGAVDKIQIQGTAPTREALAQLRIALENSPLFSKAEVPIADLARDIDLPFSITVTITPQQ